MCGICGILGGELDPDNKKSILVSMNDEIYHRGPDDDGFFFNSEVGIAMRRLSVIDLNTGKQPISNESNDIWVVFNGEIYNYNRLRDELKELGHEFSTQGDTEVIIHGYEEWGISFLNKLNGMFAIALWDNKLKELILARDRLGVKPLFYTFVNKTLIFGSEIKSLLKYPGVDRCIDMPSIDLFLRYKYIQAPATPFENIFQLPQASYMIASTSMETSIKSFWNLSFSSEQENVRTYADYKDGLRTVISNAVSDRMISDVPIGSFLSGGIDSSIIVGLMSEHSSAPVNTFSMGFDQSSYNELEYASIVAKHFDTNHHELIVNPKDLMGLLWDIVKYIEMPFGDSGAIPNYLVCKETQKHVTVALSGIGADEAFAGYERYWVEKARNHYMAIPFPIRKSIIEPVISSLRVRDSKKSVVTRAKKFINSSSLPLLDRYIDIVSVFNNHQKDSLYTQQFNDVVYENKTEDMLYKYLQSNNGTNFLSQAFFADINTILPNDYLLIGDRVSMANSLEVRAPFMDYRVMEYAASIPSHYKLKNYQTKYILKDAFRSILPKKILNRGKYGFESPIAHWIKHELKSDVEEMLLSEKSTKRGLFNKKYIETLLYQHNNNINDYRKEIFSLLTFEMWCQLYID